MRVWTWEDPTNEPLYDKEGFLEMGVSPFKAPDEATYVTLDFEKGWPVAIDGEKMRPAPLSPSSTRSAAPTASACWISWRTGWWA